MNLKAFVNLFDSVPTINIGNSSTNKHPACMIDFQPVEMLIGPNSTKFIIHNGRSDEYFKSHRSIRSIKWNGFSFNLQLEGFYEETKPVTLVDLLYSISSDMDSSLLKLTITNYDITFNIMKDGHLPKFFALHPELLERTVRRMWWNEDTGCICVQLEMEFFEIIEHIANTTL